jgi:hypothetical protein
VSWRKAEKMEMVAMAIAFVIVLMIMGGFRR